MNGVELFDTASDEAEQVVSKRPRLYEGDNGNSNNNDKDDGAPGASEHRGPCGGSDARQSEEIASVHKSTVEFSSLDACDKSDESKINNPPTATSSVGLGEALSKIREHILNSKKSTKAMSLLLRLFERRWTPGHSPARGELLDFWTRDDTLSPAHFGTAAPCFPDLCRIIEIMCASMDAVNPPSSATSCAFRVASWRLATSTRRGLSSDDTLEFVKACKVLRNQIEELHIFQPSPDTGLPPVTEFSKAEERHKTERLVAVLTCLTDAFKQHKRGWAQQPLDEVFRAASERRFVFSDQYLLDQLDSLTSQWTAHRRKQAASGGGAARTVRTADSTTHPLRQKQIGILR